MSKKSERPSPGRQFPEEGDLSLQVDELLSSLESAEEEGTERHRATAKLRPVMHLLWKCTRHELPHEINPWREGDTQESRRNRFEWPAYAVEWVGAMRKAARALLGLEEQLGMSAEEVVESSTRVRDRQLKKRLHFMQSVFSRVIAHERGEGDSLDPTIKGLADLLERDPREWAQYHQYFEWAAHALAGRVRAPKQQVSEDSAPSRRKQRKRGRGRPRRSDLNEDQRIYDAWKTEQHPTYAELAGELGLKLQDVQRAIDRQRKRIKRKPGGG